MKPLALVLLAAFTFSLSACGGGNGSTTGSSGSTGGGPTPIDPSGNWQLVAADAGGHSLRLGVLFNQVGATVTANSITPTNSLFFTCQQWAPSFTNGTVQNGNQFSGTISALFGDMAFSGTLNPEGTHVDGLYSGLAAGNCAGIAASGTLTGDEIPSASASWSGTLTPCDYSQQTAVCTPTGAAAFPIAMTLAQNDSTGNVTGTYQATTLPFSSGAVAVIPPFDILSGTTWQFTMTDSNGSKYVVNGQLATDRSFLGNAFLQPTSPGSETFKLAMSH